MNTIESLKEIILNFQQDTLFTGIKREIDFMPLENKANVFVGVRRCGKSTYLNQIIENLLKNGINIENILYINFFDDRLIEVRNQNLNLILEAYFSIYPQKKQEKVFCFFDEIQECNGWELFISRILRTENMEVYITGSSAKMLSSEIATQMRGRSLSWELFPFSFREFLSFHQVNFNVLNSETRFYIQKYFDDYLLKGGFPEVITVNEKLRIMIHQEYFKTIVHRDIIERYDTNHPKTVMQVAYRLLTTVSSLFSVNRITEHLKSIGFNVSKEFVSNCIEWFEDAYFLFAVKMYDLSAHKQNINPKKIYCVDQGLIKSVWTGFAENKGYVLENIIYVHLRRKIGKIFYYKTSNGNEVDFTWLNENGERQLLQVCWNLDIDKTRNRELIGLKQAMIETNTNSATLITYNTDDLINEDNLTIQVMPAWRYLLYH